MRKKSIIFVLLILTCLCWAADAGAKEKKIKYPKENIIPGDKIAIFPFRNFTLQPEDNWLMDGFREGITSILIEGDESKIIDRPSLDRAIAEANLQPSEYFKPEKAAEIGKKVGANVAIIGSFQHTKGSLIIFMRIVDCQTGEINNKFRVQISSPKNYRFFHDIYQLTEKIEDALGWKFNEISTKKAQKILTRTRDLKSYEFLIYGKKALLMGPGPKSQVAIVWFQEALKRDYNYSLAHAGLASGFALKAFYLKQQGQEYQFTMGKARSSLQHALSLEPDLPEYHYRIAKTYLDSDVQYLLGLTFMEKGDYNSAIEAFEKALALTPQDKMAKKYLDKCKGKGGI